MMNVESMGVAIFDRGVLVSARKEGSEPFQRDTLDAIMI